MMLLAARSNSLVRWLDKRMTYTLVTAIKTHAEAGHCDALGDACANVRVRRSMTTSSFPARTRFTGNTSDIKLRVTGDSPHYLQTSGSDSLVTGPHDSNDTRACFKMHYFQVLTVPGTVAVLESNNQRFITKDDSDNTMKLKTGNAPQQTRQTDDRFFSVTMDPGDNSAYLRHIHSGKYLSASSSGTSLVPTRPEATSFLQFDCNDS